MKTLISYLAELFISVSSGIIIFSWRTNEAGEFWGWFLLIFEAHTESLIMLEILKYLV
jgi:hypothetical protein